MTYFVFQNKLSLHQPRESEGFQCDRFKYERGMKETNVLSDAVALTDGYRKRGNHDKDATDTINFISSPFLPRHMTGWMGAGKEEK